MRPFSEYCIRGDGRFSVPGLFLEVFFRLIFLSIQIVSFNAF